MVKKVEVQGFISENTYFYIDEKSQHGFLIDPGAEGEKLYSIIKENDWKIESILITHGHFDHIGAVDELRQKLSCKAYGYRGGDQYLLHPHYNLSSFYGEPLVLENVFKVKEGDEISLSVNPSFSLKVLYTPGHTKDSCVFYNHEVSFVGDTLFENGIGNTHFPGGDEKVLWESLFEKVFSLPESLIVYPGHGEDTIIKTEKNRYKA